MADATITMTGNASQLISEIEKLNKANQKLENQFVTIKKVSRDAGDAAGKMSQGAKQALEQATTAAEKYRQTMASLRAQLDAGRISEEKFARARAAAQATFKATDPASLAKAAEAAKQQAEAAKLQANAEAKLNEARREASAIVTKYATAEEVHAAEIVKLTKLRAMGVLDEKNYARAIAATNARLKEATKDTVALAEAEKAEQKVQAAGISITNANRTARERYNENIRLAKQALDAGTISLETYNRELARQKKILDEADGSGQRFAKTLAVIGAGAVAAAAGVQALILEEQKLRNLKQQSADQNVTYGEVLARTMNNFTEDDTVTRGQLNDEFAGIQERKKIRDRKAIARVAGEAFSAKGSRTNREALTFVETAFEYAQNDEAMANTIAGRALDVSKATGVKNPRALVGFLGAAQKAARVASIEALGSEGVQAGLGGMVHGATPEQSMELFSTLNSLLVDIRGANSKTAMLAMTGQLMDEEKIQSAGLTKQFKGLGLMDRIATLQANPALADKFMKAKGVSFEGAAEPFIRKFLSGDAAAMAEYQSVKSAIPALDANAGNLFDQEIAARNKNAHVKLAMEDSAREASKQAKELADLETLAKAGVAEKTFEDTITNVDLPGFDQDVDIPVVTPVTKFLGMPVRIPGTENLLRLNAWTRTKLGQDPAAARAAALDSIQGGINGSVGPGSDRNFIQEQQRNLRGQSDDIQKAQLEELRKLNQTTNANAAPQAPQVPLFGNDPALNPQPGAR